MKFKIQNFGPITEGFKRDDGFLHLDGVTLFIGGQGTGKSSVAKSLSTMLWLEKALLKEDFTEKQLMAPGKFKSFFSYQGIFDYFRKKTVLDYQGRYYRLSYIEERLAITKMDTHDLIEQPKIMYVPSERNFLSSCKKPSTIAGLQPSLITFLDEFENAKRAITAPIALPVDRSSYAYDRLNDISWIERRGNRTRLTFASSGYQSLVPLFLVTDYLANFLEQDRMAVTAHQMRLIREKLNALPLAEGLASGTAISVLKESPFITLDDIRSSSKAVQQILKRYRPSHTINVVEEPEQNLFPDSQTRMMYSLLAYRNRNPLNRLIITTHSPYVLSAGSLAAACSATFAKNNSAAEELEKIVPSDAWIDPDTLTVYEIDEDGMIEKLDTYDNLPSDDNYLNNALGSFNDAFETIFDLEDSL